MVTKAATAERTAEPVRDWRDLTARDWSEIVVATVMLLSLVWLIWSQGEQNKRMIALQDQISKQSADIGALSAQLNRMAQDQAAAEARRAASPTMVIPQVAPSINPVPPSGVPGMSAPPLTNGSGAGSGAGGPGNGASSGTGTTAPTAP